jgi:aspartate/methionine/tyrosine aminotransferase
MRRAFDRRRKLMHQLLSGIDGVETLVPQGAFYAFPSFEGIIGRTVGGTKIESSLQLCEVILEVAKVAVVPGEAFGAPGYARLSFALGDDDLGEGVRRIADLLSK